MTSDQLGRPLSPISLIAWAAFVETLRRKDFYVLLIMVILFAAAEGIARLATNVTQATGIFLINLGMTLSFLFAAVLAIIGAARVLPAEMEARTIYPLIAKPVSRAQVVVGKWFAITATSAVSMLILFVIAFIPTPKAESLSYLLLAQTLFAKIVAFGLLASMGILFSLIMPKALNIVVLAIVYTVSGSAMNFLRAKAMSYSAPDVYLWASAYLPNFDLMDFSKRFTDGAGPLEGPQFLGILLYGVIATIFALSLSCFLFERRSL